LRLLERRSDVRRLLSVGIIVALSGPPAIVGAAQVGPEARSAAASPDYLFAAGTALLLFYVRPDRVSDFEAVTARISQALAASADPVRRQQAGGWRMFRSSEAARDAVVFVFLLDPVVPGADYDPVRILSEGLPNEVQPLYERLKAAVIRVERMGLSALH
jgi:hypothetical protein